MSYRVRYTRAAREDLVRLYRFWLDEDLDTGERALATIRQSLTILQTFPFTCRKVDARNPFLRELIVSFGASGYVALFEIEDDRQVTILAIRHQREDDYH
ncbi:type II toxin-antitoxin system RelE/ParE family toxin (plasmid) [Burkholderia sp. FERM BP-3421]|uniref:type II toxin-antitoxin system RelE/ParE family toxin n=1 Tax=Burkholderia sp. FERM BP-3421 TaxID=1494466 RepID=UPI00235E0509|nr:type II toxin-antitoxin system RelE/ParE family toxin [Burkholderia sp. FERM BP-3421]WDD90616.1 type II toxin-antitoxin system RelE/ParE family toxin [Burkholderia sp. FERM BP-3421]